MEIENKSMSISMSMSQFHRGHLVSNIMIMVVIICVDSNTYAPHNAYGICSINLYEVEMLVDPMCFPMLFHDPLNDCLNFKKHEY